MTKEKEQSIIQNNSNSEARQGKPAGLWIHACFSLAISVLCWRTAARRTATSSSSSSRRLLGASCSSVACWFLNSSLNFGSK
jgi:hypothetical protein